VPAGPSVCDHAQTLLPIDSVVLYVHFARPRYQKVTFVLELGVCHVLAGSSSGILRSTNISLGWPHKLRVFKRRHALNHRKTGNADSLAVGFKLLASSPTNKQTPLTFTSPGTCWVIYLKDINDIAQR
jgi:hypothetical protein